jgi:hypothetical protein
MLPALAQPVVEAVADIVAEEVVNIPDADMRVEIVPYGVAAVKTAESSHKVDVVYTSRYRIFKCPQCWTQSY